MNELNINIEGMNIVETEAFKKELEERFPHCKIDYSEDGTINEVKINKYISENIEDIKDEFNLVILNDINWVEEIDGNSIVEEFDSFNYDIMSEVIERVHNLCGKGLRKDNRVLQALNTLKYS